MPGRVGAVRRSGVVVGAPVLAVLGARWPSKHLVLLPAFAADLGA
ncbi:hypothetical protein [Pseudonocardia parietis]|uniref:Uncharacterized protein n=1 Tax=Pseudonocardia parietis TaxID=570936 RepID=A0ABS4VQB7_9PSEU|nr:hypothetical protein [Pseudonocardia parietis]MBP2366115.1 hypothetical protein [Pseudonocardia parietis]